MSLSLSKIFCTRTGGLGRSAVAALRRPSSLQDFTATAFLRDFNAAGIGHVGGPVT